MGQLYSSEFENSSFALIELEAVLADPALMKILMFFYVASALSVDPVHEGGGSIFL